MSAFAPPPSESAADTALQAYLLGTVDFDRALALQRQLAYHVAGNRGGGCLLHLPGQMAIYPILPLDRLGLGLQSYLDRLRQALIDVLDDFSVPAAADGAGVCVGARPVAHLGVAVRDWVTYYGAAL